jgi:ribosomal-protein-alanine N-acetyltransferase
MSHRDERFETKRLILRGFTSDDWPGVQQLAINKESSDAAAYDHTWPTSEDGCRDAALYLSQNDFWAVCLKQDNRLIGLIAFNGVDENNSLDLGHLFHTDFVVGTDYVVEAIEPMMRYAFETMDIDRIVARNVPEWTTQIAPLKELGMTQSEAGSDGELVMARETWEARHPEH